MIEEKYISISDTEIFIVVKGQGFPLFVLHGGPGLDHHAFGSYLDDLSQDYQLIFVDLRGQGKSKDVDFKTLTTKRMAQDIVEIAKHLGYGEYGLVGHSFGAFVALQHGVDFPGVAKYIVLIAGASSGKEVLEYTALNYAKIPSKLVNRVQKAQINLEKSKTSEEFHKAWGEYTSFYFSYPTNEEQLAAFNKQTLDVNIRFDVLNHCQKTGFGFFDVSKDLNKVSSPVLILAGEQDNVCSLEGQININRKLQNSKLIVFKTGHMVFAENKPKFLEEIRSFIKIWFLSLYKDIEAHFKF